MTTGIATGRQVVDRVVDKIASLYSLPGAAIKLLRCLEDPACEVGEIRSILETDPALVAKVLRVVNSAFFGLGSKVSDLGQALALLGRSKLRLIVLGFSLPENLFSNVERQLLGRYWGHTLAKATTAREIAVLADRKLAEECFLVGLLEDIGILCLVPQLGKPYCRLVQLAWDTGAVLIEVERRALGFSHREVSSSLLARWGFPETILATIRARDRAASTFLQSGVGAGQVDKVEFQAAIVALAEIVVEESGSVSDPSGASAPSQDILATPRSPQVVEQYKLGLLSALRITENQLEAVRATVDHKVRELAELLNIDLLPSEKLGEVKEESRKLLAEVAAEAAENLLQLELAAHCREKFAFPKPLDQAHSGQQIERSYCEVRKGDDPPAVKGDLLSAPQPPSLAAGLLPERRARASANSPPSRSYPIVDVVHKEEQDPGLTGFLRAAIAACRGRKCPLSLLLIELIGINDVLPFLGPRRLAEVRGQLEELPQIFNIPREWIRAYGEWGLALILPEHDRPAATELANQFARWWNSNRGAEVTGLRLRIGLAQGIATAALPSKNLRPELLIDRAERCLFGSRIHGGMVKSIEL
ncbi:MAG: HDOD domain-containing protein [Thermoguttaceae bacterium]|nr:HDOD domain-containing protein [Thermoguttaceae bacterium]MDW8077307.1 HDOD domain-containing protein [Thermoguttaceae bacterium]